MSTDIAEHERRFNSYAQSMMRLAPGDAEPMLLKMEHTEKVVENAAAISAGARISGRLRRCCLLGALYHDTGRFQQYLRYRTFRDAESCDHGIMGVRAIRDNLFLNEEPAEVRRNVLVAVTLHNRFRLPRGLDDDARLVTAVVRDADKLDILRIMDEHLNRRGEYNPTVILGLPDTNAYHSEKVISDAESGLAAAYADLRTINDFRLLLGTWFHDLSFAESRRRFVTDGHALKIVAGLPKTGPYAAARKSLLDLIGKNGSSRQ